MSSGTWPCNARTFSLIKPGWYVEKCTSYFKEVSTHVPTIYILHLPSYVGRKNYYISESSNVQVKERVKHRVRFCRKALHNGLKLILKYVALKLSFTCVFTFIFILFCNRHYLLLSFGRPQQFGGLAIHL